MYAIIADGGRQYRVEEGQELDVDYREATTGDEIEFGQILAISSPEGVQLGQPTVTGAKVTAQVLGIEQGEKLSMQKFRRRKNTADAPDTVRCTHGSGSTASPPCERTSGPTLH